MLNVLFIECNNPLKSVLPVVSIVKLKIEKTIKESPMNIVYIMIGGSIGALIIYFLF